MNILAPGNTQDTPDWRRSGDTGARLNRDILSCRRGTWLWETSGWTRRVVACLYHWKNRRSSRTQTPAHRTPLVSRRAKEGRPESSLRLLLLLLHFHGGHQRTRTHRVRVQAASPFRSPSQDCFPLLCHYQRCLHEAASLSSLRRCKTSQGWIIKIDPTSILLSISMYVIILCTWGNPMLDSSPNDNHLAHPTNEL